VHVGRSGAVVGRGRDELQVHRPRAGPDEVRQEEDATFHDGHDDGRAAGVRGGEHLAELTDTRGNLVGADQDFDDLVTHVAALAPRAGSGATAHSTRMARTAKYGFPGSSILNVPRNVPAGDNVIAHGSII